MVSLRNLFKSTPRPEIPAGQRVYAVGDVHGCLYLLKALADEIERDDAERGPAETTIILLGDLVDRGPDSAGVIAFARAWQHRRTVRILTGNHEEMFLESFDNLDVLREFLRYGGRETVLSYRIDPATYHRAELDEVQELMIRHVAAEDRQFIGTFEASVTIGDYHFVHAGVRPGVPLDQQRLSDLRWIRRPFLDSQESFGAVIVHGHTIFAKPEVKANRISLDTGAYASGRLTALGLQGTARWLIEAQERDGAISVAQRSIR